MKTHFKTKLLQHLAQKKANQGFTLIELLVVVIFLGVLAAIALPNLLGQVGKARQSEAKNWIGAANRTQQGYYTEHQDFATSLANLEIPAGNPKYYQFFLPTISGGSGGTAYVHHAKGNNNAKNGTKDYVGGVSYNSDTRAFATIICVATTAPDYDLSGSGTINYLTNATTVTGTTRVGCAASGVAEAK